MAVQEPRLAGEDYPTYYARIGAYDRFQGANGSSLADEMDRVAAGEIDAAIQEQEIQGMYNDRVTQFLSGQLFEVPQATMEALNTSIEAAYGPEYAALQKSGVDMENVIREQGVTALNQLREARATAERSFQLFSEEERQNLLDTAAASGRGPTDPALLRDFADTLGKSFSTMQAGLTAAERGIGDTTRERLLGLARGQAASGGLLEANKAATKAAQRFSMQTGLPAQIAAGGQAAQLNSALDYQNLVNNSVIAGQISGQASPLTSARLAQPTTTQRQGYSPLDVFGGILGGVGKIAGAFA